MMQYRPWDIWLAHVRFENSPGAKNRPVLITSSGSVFVLAFMLTSHTPRDAWGEYFITEWRYAGLSKSTTIRISKQFHLEPHDMIHRIGTLHASDRMGVRQIIASAAK